MRRLMTLRTDVLDVLQCPLPASTPWDPVMGMTRFPDIPAAAFAAFLGPFHDSDTHHLRKRGGHSPPLRSVACRWPRLNARAHYFSALIVHIPHFGHTVCLNHSSHISQ